MTTDGDRQRELIAEALSYTGPGVDVWEYTERVLSRLDEHGHSIYSDTAMDRIMTDAEAFRQLSNRYALALKAIAHRCEACRGVADKALKREVDDDN